MPFSLADRVELSKEGKKVRLSAKTGKTGYVLGYDQFGCILVLWVKVRRIRHEREEWITGAA